MLNRLQTCKVLGQEAKHLAMVHLAKDVHFALGNTIVLCQVGTQAAAKAGPVGSNLIEKGDQQLNQQQRVPAKVFGSTAGCAHNVCDTAQGHLVLLEQGKVGAASGSSLKKC